MNIIGPIAVLTVCAVILITIGINPPQQGVKRVVTGRLLLISGFLLASAGLFFGIEKMIDSHWAATMIMIGIVSCTMHLIIGGKTDIRHNRQ